MNPVFDRLANLIVDRLADSWLTKKELDYHIVRASKSVCATCR
jgi:hypothetical protein